MYILQSVGMGSGGAAALLFPMLMVAATSSLLSYFLNYLLDNHPLGQFYLSQIQKLPENIAKVAGECLLCSGAWQYLILAFFYFELPLPICLIGLGANHAFLRLLNHFTEKMEDNHWGL
jgi:hypothetical protein